MLLVKGQLLPEEQDLGAHRAPRSALGGLLLGNEVRPGSSHQRDERKNRVSVKPSELAETWFSMAQTQVRRKAILIKNMVIEPQLAPGLRQSGREETKEVKLSISIVLRARMEFLRTTVSILRSPTQNPFPSFDGGFMASF